MLGTSRTVAGGHGGHPFPHDDGTLGRTLRFALVGGTCFAVQLAILRLLGAAGIGRTVANAVGFATSAQLNFALSRTFTWADGRGDRAGRGDAVAGRDRRTLAQWGSYNVTALVALGVNTLVFAAAVGTTGEVPAALAGVAAGTVVTFLVCDRLIFRSPPTDLTAAPLPTPRPSPRAAASRRTAAGRHLAGQARHFASPPADRESRARQPSPDTPWETP